MDEQYACFCCDKRQPTYAPWFLLDCPHDEEGTLAICSLGCLVVLVMGLYQRAQDIEAIQVHSTEES